MEGDNTNEMYKECLRNHAASLGSYATDGCGEFTPVDDGGLNCAACCCHRNFHRKVTLQADCGRLMTAYDTPDRSSIKKRFRTKFTAEQKERMLGFAERMGWRLPRKGEEGDDEIERFCRGVGISRKVFKVWMHNHKNCTTGNTSSDLTHQS